MLKPEFELHEDHRKFVSKLPLFGNGIYSCVLTHPKVLIYALDLNLNKGDSDENSYPKEGLKLLFRENGLIGSIDIGAMLLNLHYNQKSRVNINIKPKKAECSKYPYVCIEYDVVTESENKEIKKFLRAVVDIEANDGKGSLLSSMTSDYDYVNEFPDENEEETNEI